MENGKWKMEDGKWKITLLEYTHGYYRYFGIPRIF
jgi:hypothetical protein